MKNPISKVRKSISLAKKKMSAGPYEGGQSAVQHLDTALKILGDCWENDVICNGLFKTIEDLKIEIKGNEKKYIDNMLVRK